MRCDGALVRGAAGESWSALETRKGEGEGEGGAICHSSGRRGDRLLLVVRVDDVVTALLLCALSGEAAGDAVVLSLGGGKRGDGGALGDDDEWKPRGDNDVARMAVRCGSTGRGGGARGGDEVRAAGARRVA